MAKMSGRQVAGRTGGTHCSVCGLGGLGQEKRGQPEECNSLYYRHLMDDVMSWAPGGFIVALRGSRCSMLAGWVGWVRDGLVK